MKKLFLLVILIGIGAFIYAYTKEKSAEPVNTPPIEQGSTFQPDPSNATFTFDDGKITLSDGKIERPVEPGSTFMEEISLLEERAYGDVNGDGRNDTVVFIARYGGGSGTFIYAAAFVSGPVTYQGSRVFLLGDRVSPQSISIENGVIIVNYLDRAPGEPFAAEPTVPTTLELTFRNGELRER